MTRGSLRIYLGAAPGVGKTVAMLSEGARRAARGTDVVVGFVETHDRPLTMAATQGLEIVPRRTVRYRDANLEEMDLAAILARKPDCVLVDELAHTNVPGAGNEKRWQDIQELLDAGINVVSTVNIQHLESLNDAAYAITKVRQRETVPDAVVRGADQIELVDMSPESLRRRMAHGNIYAAGKVDAALSNYFRQGNLTALRELALLWLADRVDESLGRYRADHDITGTWPTRERIVVALSGGPEGETLLRRAARMASRGSGGELHAVHVARDDGLAGSSLPIIAQLRRLTEELGGTFHTVAGPEPSAAVLNYARAVNATQIVLGISRQPRWRSLLRRGTGEAIIADSGEIDVYVVTHEFARSGIPVVRKTAMPRSRVVQGLIAAVVAPVLLTAALCLLPDGVGFGLPLTVQLYLLVTVLVALLGGMIPAITAGVISSLLINWFFTPPLGTLTISDPQNASALVLFVVVAAVVSLVVHRSARRSDAVTSASAESAALAELSHTMLSSTDQLALLLRRSVDMFGATGAAIVTRPSPGHPKREVIAESDGFDAEANTGDWGAVEQVDQKRDLVLAGPPIAADRQRLLAAYAAHAGAVLHRRHLQTLAQSAQDLERDNRARTTLLSAVSHDLRTPLAGIKAAVGSLRSTDVTFSAEDEAELLEAIETSADRLDALIGNLLDMSRLQTGSLVAQSRVIDLAEVIGPTVRALGEPDRVAWTMGEDARRAIADPGLLDRVLANLLENGLRFQPLGTPILLNTSRLADRVEIRVIDNGPGVGPDQREAIFRPFQRYGDAPGGDGVGLGLAVARGFTEAMGGALVAEDTPGGGITMVVSLRALEDDEP